MDITDQNSIKILVTLGPSLSRESDLLKLKDKGVDFVRVNMSHSTLDDLKSFIELSNKVNIPFVIDTEGSQIRTVKIAGEIDYHINDEIIIHGENYMIDDENHIGLKPSKILFNLDPGDILYIDFRSLSILISETKDVKKGFIKGKVLTGGTLGNSKGVYIDSTINKNFHVDPLSNKDIKSIKLAKNYHVKYIAASFIRSANFVKEVKKAVDYKMKVISKIECKEALVNIDEIINESDYLLIDRGDLSKEIPLEKIPQIQKIIIEKAAKKKKRVFIATNLLESMIDSKTPTKAEVHDIVRTINDGAGGLILAAETAIGKHPLKCVNMVQRLINHTNDIATPVINTKRMTKPSNIKIINEYLNHHTSSSLLIKPHGGSLINRLLTENCEVDTKNNSNIITVNKRNLADLEQIAIGTYSPLNGFMNESELNLVLDEYHLNNGELWTVPVVLDITRSKSKMIKRNDEVMIANQDGKIIGKIEISDIYEPDKNDLCKRLYNDADSKHYGIKFIQSLKPIFIGGQIKLIKKFVDHTNPYNLSPSQIRRHFDEKNWRTVIGFHTRNVIHRGHEFLQIDALRSTRADGLLIHPAVGEKKTGDYTSKYIIKSYEFMMKNIFLNQNYCFATLPIYSRYLGIREAIFTAICRQNYGCSHFIMGRDHTNMNELNHFNKYYSSQELLNELDIKILNYNSVVFSKKSKSYFIIDENDQLGDMYSISATRCREILKKGNFPPSWMMRKEISEIILKDLKAGLKVFI